MPEIHDTSRAIGTLEGKLDQVIAAQYARTEQDRQRWHKVFDELNGLKAIALDVIVAKQSIADHTAKHRDVDARLSEIEGMKNKAIGAVFALSLAGSAIGAKIAAFFKG